MKIAILSDIHGNLKALEAVLSNIEGQMVDAFIFLGDMIDYGPHSNEVVDIIKKIEKPVLCNIWGNHEKAVLNEEYDRFSSDRGRDSAKFTLQMLSEDTKKYLNSCMTKEGIYSFEVDDIKVLAVHGNLEDHYWKSIKPDVSAAEYADYDLVLSGHSHEPHFFEKYVKTECEETRNRKKVIFINPGSVGQPRNINSYAQYVWYDTESEEVRFVKVLYDINKEMDCFSSEIDEFYKNRLKRGV